MKNLKEYILESSNKEKIKAYVLTYEKFKKDIEQILSKSKLYYADYKNLGNILLQYFKWGNKEKLGYCSYITSDYMKEKRGISSIYDVSGNLSMTLKFDNGDSISAYYSDFTDKDKYETDYDKEVFNVEKCIRNYFTSYIESEFQKNINRYSRFIK